MSAYGWVPFRLMARELAPQPLSCGAGFNGHHMRVCSLNVLTEIVHARRSQLLFSKALGPEISVGIIAIPNPDYDARRWWRSSEGLKDLFSESLGCFYARFFCRPSKDLDGNNRPVLGYR